ncbi:Aste57867_23886 [Aphanomyces stellatus]|uniref:Aste57867_23886 protein n=1 Tax=Aphanomyces stellatus TaxID=120398 RepID=A0A485LQR5_9STRA|nr:hypothetical protein As57867_023813 [Aphanomyces stellatus]VFU00529.1 Aste57867_23886 [Aphanomyces stellatus]
MARRHAVLVVVALWAIHAHEGTTITFPHSGLTRLLHLHATFVTPTDLHHHSTVAAPWLDVAVSIALSSRSLELTQDGTMLHATTNTSAQHTRKHITSTSLDRIRSAHNTSALDDSRQLTSWPTLSSVRGDLCIDLISSVVHQSTTCVPFAVHVDNGTIVSLHVAVGSLPVGEYVAIARVHLSHTDRQHLHVRYDTRRLVLLGHCLAKAEIRSPRNGHVLSPLTTVSVVPKVVVARHGIRLPPATVVCLGIDGDAGTCLDGTITPLVFTLTLPPSPTTYDLRLWLQVGGTPIPSVCSDLIHVHVLATPPPPTWPRRLHVQHMVAVHPAAIHAADALSPDVARAFDRPHPRSCPHVRHTTNLTNVSVVVVDAWADTHNERTIDWSRYISTEFHELLTLVQDRYNVRHLALSAFVQTLEAPPDVVVYFEAPGPDVWTVLRTHLPPTTTQLLFCDDLQGCHLTSTTSSFRTAFFGSLHGIISTYAYAVPAFFHPATLPRLHWLPHAASAAFSYDDIHPSPVPRVLLVGATDARYYPLRAWAAASSQTLSIDVHIHPGYEGFASAAEAAAQTAAYARLGHSYLATFTDTSRLDYLVAKVFEIPATGSLLLVNRDAAPLLAALGFVDGVHYLGYDPHDPTPTIEYVLQPLHRQHVDRMRAAGQRLVRATHTTAHRAEELWQILVANETTWSMDGLVHGGVVACGDNGYAGESPETCEAHRRAILTEACCLNDSRKKA